MKISPLACAVVLAPCVVQADSITRDQALRLPDSLITANRSVEKRKESVATSSVFTRADIERLRPSNVLELLTHVPGVQVANYGGRGANYGLYIRGTSTAQSLVLIDGVRVGSATVGGASLQYLSVEQIERVEVLRGSRSAIYGADAMGGVVQIFTKRGQDQGLNPSVRLAAGSDHTFEQAVGLSGGNQSTRFSINLANESTQGFDRTRTSYGSDADHDAYRNRSISANLSHQLTDSVEVGASVLDQRGQTEYDNPFGRYDPITYDSYPGKPFDRFSLSSTQLYVDAALNALWHTRVELGHSEDKQENFDKLDSATSVNNTYRDSINWLNTLSLNEANTLRVGAEYLNDKVRSSNDLAETSRKNHAVFIQHSYQGDGFNTEIGMRHDKNEQYGSANTFNAALSVALNEANQLTLGYAEGFRVPTFADLYWPFDGSYGGNPNLKPETSKTLELKWRSELSETAVLEASVYRSDFKDLITYTSDPVTWIGTMDNVERARIHGFEASLSQEFAGIKSVLGISLLDARNRENGHTLPNRARRTLSWDVDKQLGAVGVGASFKAVSKSFANGANSSKLSGYGVLDLRASWQANPALGFDIKWANVLDKDYSRLSYSHLGQEYGYQETPSSVMLGLTWTPSL